MRHVVAPPCAHRFLADQARPVAFVEPFDDVPAATVATPADDAAAPTSTPGTQAPHQAFPQATCAPATAAGPDRPRPRAWTALRGLVGPSEPFLWILAAAVTVLSAIGAKALGPVQPMAAIQASAGPAATAPAPMPGLEHAPVPAQAPALAPDPAAATDALADALGLPEGAQPDRGVRWFNGRPVRPARTIRMTVTAYSPDAASCAPFADGQTATLHGVQTNGGFLVAADTDLLPFGSLLTIEGYAGDQIVPVLDRGGAIKGNRLDVLFPTHEAARRWGVRTIDVVVWEYADGRPADDPRRLR
ncbi:MAG: hypothetical protein KatS3mg103_0669 [Phycisphaerales bacterium]|nr:MAG: hypothetical protein KatS3mg103_0669 [Phycisphaerales bacterium]